MAKEPDKTITLTQDQLEEIVSRMVEHRVEARKEAEQHERSELEKAIEAWWNEPVPVRLFRDGRDYKADVYVSVNDYRAQIKRGVEVMVPRRVARVIEESLDQSNIASDRVREVADTLASM